MDELTTLHPNGLFLRREALELGYRDEDLRDAKRAGVLHPVRHGAYVPTATWSAITPEDRYRLRGQAVLLTHPGRVALCHTSAAAEHGLRLWGVPLDRVHVLRLDGGTGRTTRDIVYHEGTWTPDDVWSSEELLLVGAERAAVETASLTSVESGLVTTDSVLDLDLGTPESLWAAYERDLRGTPYAAKLAITMRLTRPGSQSAGETRGRYLCLRHHLPAPVLQFEVRDHRGVLVGVTDYAWPEHGLLGEFDGMVKYHRSWRSGEDATAVVIREKVREDLLRDVTGWRMIRLIWADLATSYATAARIRARLRRSSSAA